MLSLQPAMTRNCFPVSTVFPAIMRAFDGDPYSAFPRSVDLFHPQLSSHHSRHMPNPTAFHRCLLFAVTRGFRLSLVAAADCTPSLSSEVHVPPLPSPPHVLVCSIVAPLLFSAKDLGNNFSALQTTHLCCELSHEMEQVGNNQGF